MRNILEYLEITETMYPHQTAVDDQESLFTWKELAEISRKMGTAFAEKTSPGKPVVIFAPKSAITLAAMFGAVYAGGFYVVVDPSQPVKRVQEILKILKPQLAVADERSLKLLKQIDYKGNICGMKEAMQRKEDRALLQRIREHSRDTDILYGIFTSGSTGIPKGIVVSHRSVMDFISHFVEIFNFTVHDRIGNQAPFDFDVSVKDIYTGMMTGAALIIIPKEMFSTPPLLLDYLCEKKVTTLIWAVSALSLVATLKGLSYRVPERVKKILFSGEVMPAKQLRLWQMALPEAEFVNLYGPTEITCNCTYYKIREMFPDGEKIPIGRAFPGREVFLLDEDQREIVSPEKVGEICVSGESLSEGYYGNSEESRKRFIDYPKEDHGTKRCYKTGDLGYYGRNGELYFSGRKDFQIKHMGHRIELEEIERVMEQIAGLERAICLMDEKRNRLVAFYLGDINPCGIREKMKDKLPDYMIPHKVIKAEAMPLNKNGKTDRNYFRQKLR